LVGLGFVLQPIAEAAAWDVTVPSWRWFDFEPRPDGRVYEADFFEEVIRIHGFAGIPAALPALAGSDGPATERQRVRQRTRTFLAGLGYAEAINFGFDDPKAAANLPSLRPGLEPLLLANPLSEHHRAMRQSLLANLLASARFNQRRGAAAVRLFEVGTVFYRRGAMSPGAAPVNPHDRTAELPDEQEQVALICGGKVGQPWDREVALDLFDLKGAVEALAETLGVRLTARSAELTGLLVGSAAELLDDAGRVVGICGRLAEEEGYPLYVAEVALAALAGGAAVHALSLPPRVPGIAADLTLTHALRVSWQELEDAIAALRSPELTSFALKIRYQGDGVPEGAVNTTVTFHYNAADRTLTQDVVNERQQALATELNRQFGWKG
jgi:phenylalanyl-tRNA synthetase beta chain